ncbi:transposase [Rhizobium sp. MHM7A]|uniref:transposase n=1 Tax=Rhizobium sp. MHM7A TaxID=2583233 RepID=UPI001106ADB8|nr:transposase [Rhizobium sp. MHM7A]TLX16360.1 transposase [Rhizobium sp. MHM7A]
MLEKFSRLDDKQWDVIVKALKAAGGNLSRNTRDHVDGILFLMQHDLPWRDLDPAFGKWNSVYVRFTRWTEKGVLDQLVIAFQKLGLTERWNTEWVEYSRSQGAKAAPTRREIIAKNVVEGSLAPLKDVISAVETHNFSKPKTTKYKSTTASASEEASNPEQKTASSAKSAHAKRQARKQNRTLTAIRERRERRRQFGLRHL